MFVEKNGFLSFNRGFLSFYIFVHVTKKLQQNLLQLPTKDIQELLFEKLKMEYIVDTRLMRRREHKVNILDLPCQPFTWQDCPGFVIMQLKIFGYSNFNDWLVKVWVVIL